jgi:hypothetical protein
VSSGDLVKPMYISNIIVKHRRGIAIAVIILSVFLLFLQQQEINTSVEEHATKLMSTADKTERLVCSYSKWVSLVPTAPLSDLPTFSQIVQARQDLLTKLQKAAVCNESIEHQLDIRIYTDGLILRVQEDAKAR